MWLLRLKKVNKEKQQKKKHSMHFFLLPSRKLLEKGIWQEKNPDVTDSKVTHGKATSLLSGTLVPSDQ